jgi:hypothetical protein
VLDHYPPRDPAPTSPPLSTPSATSSTSPPGTGRVGPTAATGTAGPASPPSSTPLITLDRPFDVDEFSSLLGGTSVRVTVPRESLPEVLRRVLEFMDFGIYVYQISVRPAPAELLKGFVVELQRVDYAPEKRAWVPFVERGVTDSPYGSSDDRR